jgi:high-affinity Fe2+/Pb2+ permease
MIDKSKNHWRLSLMQFFLITVISLSPTLGAQIIYSLFGDKSPAIIFALLPALPFLAFGWVGGITFATLFSNPSLKSLAYYTGFSLTVFALAYMCLVNWRYHRAKKKSAKVNEEGGAIHPS